ncbi:MAG: acetyl-CoA synthase subunit delta, partial [Archaeoglobaceae archaeon]
MAKRFTFEDFLALLKKYDVEVIEDVRIDGDLEIELEGSAVNLTAFAAIQSLLNEFANFLYHANMALTYLQRLSTMLGIQLPISPVQIPAVPEVKAPPEVK